jgi:hypothetical protein
MPVHDLIDRGPLRGVHATLGGPLVAGDVAHLHAAPGVGKSAFLVHLGLERILRGEGVLHIATAGSVQTVRDAYDSGLSGLLRDARPADGADAALLVERHRLVHIAHDVPPDWAVRIGTLLDTLRDALGFAPTLVVVDGATPPDDGLAAMATARGVAVAFAHPGSALATYGIVLELVSDRAGVVLHVRRDRHGAPRAAPLRLDAGLFFARANLPAPTGERLAPGEVTLHSGGAAGAEAAFGACAERWGVREINYTFDGHAQARTRGAHPLTEQALAQGDVSLAYVSRRLRRTYGQGSVIRRVLQSLWHQVGAAQEIFVVGTIQEDGTVTGGTGWSVELARMWNKRVWVYDQDKDGWFCWNGDDWVPATPTITTATVCGTGTRSLTADGRRAIEELYARSFGGAP